MKKILIRIFILLLLLLFGAYVYLFEMSPVDEKTDFDLNLDTLRGMASVMPGSEPVRINGMVIAKGAFPKVAVIAGRSPWRKQEIVFVSYQVVFSDQSSMIIDPVHNKALHDKFFAGQPYYPDRYEQMQSGMEQSSLIIVTHEHVDHIGGLARSRNLVALAPKTFLTVRQLGSPYLNDSFVRKEDKALFTARNVPDYYPVRRGVVLRQAAGHSPGSQIIYIRLADRQEFLFLGDIVWNLDNIRFLTGRPNLVSRFLLHEDREAVADQIRTIYLLMKKGIDHLHFVISHDPDQFKDLVQSGVVGSEWETVSTN